MHICTVICTWYSYVHITYARCICDTYIHVCTCMCMYVYVFVLHRSCIWCICACIFKIFYQIHADTSRYAPKVGCISACICLYFEPAYMHICTIKGVHICLYLSVSLCSSACSAVASPYGRSTGTFAARVAHAQADRRFHSNHVQHVQLLKSAARHDCISRRQQVCSVARWSLNRCLGTVGWQWFTSSRRGASEQWLAIE